MQKKKISLSKLIPRIAAGILVVVLLLGTTLALRDFNQHKTNYLSNSNKNMDVTLNENFQPHDNWEENETIDKTVNVTNVGKATNPEAVYVRLALKEYMDITEIEYEYKLDLATGLPYRFLTNENGEFVTFPDSGAADAYATALGLVGTRSVQVSDKNALDPASTGGEWYIKTDFGDINGQYGKYLVINIKDEETKRVPDKKPVWDKAHDGVAFEREEGDLFEYHEFDRYIWNTPSDIREYVQVNFGDVIAMSDWDGNPVAKWIYDDISPASSTKPYVYWGKALDPTDTTSNFLNSVTLIKQPEGKFYYSIRVDMETVIKDQLDDMEAEAPIPAEILDAWNIAPLIKTVFTEDDITDLFSDTRPTPTLNTDGTLTFNNGGASGNGPVIDIKDYYTELPEKGLTASVKVKVDDPSASLHPLDVTFSSGGSYAGEIDFMVDALMARAEGASAPAPVSITAGEWYTFETTVYPDAAGKLVREMNIYDKNGAPIYTYVTNGITGNPDAVYDDLTPGVLWFPVYGTAEFTVGAVSIIAK